MRQLVCAQAVGRDPVRGEGAPALPDDLPAGSKRLLPTVWPGDWIRVAGLVVWRVELLAWFGLCAVAVQERGNPAGGEVEGEDRERQREHRPGLWAGAHDRGEAEDRHGRHPPALSITRAGSIWLVVRPTRKTDDRKASPKARMKW